MVTSKLSTLACFYLFDMNLLSRELKIREAFLYVKKIVSQHITSISWSIHDPKFLRQLPVELMVKVTEKFSAGHLSVFFPLLPLDIPLDGDMGDALHPKMRLAGSECPI
jgi:hypothetical protein